VVERLFKVDILTH